MTRDEKTELLVNHTVDTMSLEGLVYYSKLMMTRYLNNKGERYIDGRILEEGLLSEDEL